MQFTLQDILGSWKCSQLILDNIFSKTDMNTYVHNVHLVNGEA